MNRIFLSLAVLLCMPANLPAESLRAPQEWNFDVFLGKQAIGYHRFEASKLDQGLLVRSNADFTVKFLFITAFDYEHSNSEVWRNGCLRSIDAQTYSNGEQSAVLGSQQGGRFVVETGGDSKPVAECVSTFAYWNQDLLQRDRLLNAQTGEYVDVQMSELTDGTITVEDQEIAVQRLRLSAKDIDIIVSYAKDTGAWLGLDSMLANGRKLIYRRSSAGSSSQDVLALKRNSAESAGS